MWVSNTKQIEGCRLVSKPQLPSWQKEAALPVSSSHSLGIIEWKEPHPTTSDLQKKGEGFLETGKEMLTCNRGTKKAGLTGRAADELIKSAEEPGQTPCLIPCRPAKAP